MQMLCNIFFNPVIATNERIIIQQFLVLKKENVLFIYLFFFFFVYGNDSLWHMIIWAILFQQ